MATRVAYTVAWRAAWDKINQMIQYTVGTYNSWTSQKYKLFTVEEVKKAFSRQ